MNDNKSKEAKANLAERGASCEGAREGKRRKAQGVSEWSKLVHSLGLPEKSLKHGLFTKDTREGES